MSTEIVTITTITPTATADTVDLVDATYPFLLQGASSTQTNRIIEVMCTGQAAASAPTIMLLSRDSTVAVTNSLGAGQTHAWLNAQSTILTAPTLVGNTNTTKPQRSVAAHLLNLSFNAYGGNIRWVGVPNYHPTIVGNTAPAGEVSFSAFTGGSPGLMGAHMIYETI
jgi:hypothetical protein